MTLMIESLQEALRTLGLTGTQFFLLSVLLFVVMLTGSLVVAAWVLVRLPATYFCDDPPRTPEEVRRPLAVRWAFLVVKNLLGVVLVVLGVLLSLPGIPGQGVLTILMGIMLLDFPGKRRLERWVVTRPSVLRTVNRLRARYGRPPLVLGDGPAPTLTNEPQ